jgi:hypothetical protein
VSLVLLPHKLATNVVCRYFISVYCVRIICARLNLSALLCRIIFRSLYSVFAASKRLNPAGDFKSLVAYPSSHHG